MEIFEGYSKQFLFFTSLFTRLDSTTRVSLIRSISRSRNFVSRREDARGAAAISTGSALSRARAHTLRHTANVHERVRGGRGNATSHSTTTRVNKQCLSSNDAARMTDIRGSEAARKRKRAARLNKENEKHLERSGEEGGEEEKDKRIERRGNKRRKERSNKRQRSEEKRRTDGAGNGLAEAPKAVHMNTSLSISTRTEELCPMHDRYSQIQSRSGLVQSRSRTTARYVT